MEQKWRETRADELRLRAIALADPPTPSGIHTATGPKIYAAKAPSSDFSLALAT